MNETQIKAFRQLAEDVLEIPPRQPMTAREMALVSHNLNKRGTLATTADGHKYIWINRFSQWYPFSGWLW
jgi:hypothetical protein